MVITILFLLQVVGGPTVFVCLQAKVLIPTMTLSCGKVEFATIQCGLCLVETIQLTNHQQVPCEWFVNVDKPVNKVNELWSIHCPHFLPLHFSQIYSSNLHVPYETLLLQHLHSLLSKIKAFGPTFQANHAILYGKHLLAPAAIYCLTASDSCIR